MDVVFRFTRTSLQKRKPQKLNRTEVPLLIWLQHGQAWLHLSDGKEPVEEGELLFIRAKTAFALQGRGDETHSTALRLPTKMITAIAKRHPELQGRWFWSLGDSPARAKRDIRQMADLSGAAIRLEAGPATGLNLEAFLMPLFADLMPQGPELPEDAPEWLRQARDAARRPEVFREGASGLARVAGRAHPHVARTVRRYLGQTPSDFINGIRMDVAAKKLAGTDESIAEIAEGVGLPNLSHFHRLFREAHGKTPLAYRKANGLTSA